jgi:enoyl-CoA hydratase/carnithine racemase
MLLSSGPRLTLFGLVSFPLVEAAPAKSQTHLAEVTLASGATLTVERSGQIALFGINRLLATAYYDYGHDSSLRAAVFFGYGEHFSRGIDIDAFESLLAIQHPWGPCQGDNRPAREAATIPLQAPRRRSPWRYLEHG